MSQIDKLLEKAFDLGIQLLIAIVIIILGFKVIKIIEKTLKKQSKWKKLDLSVSTFLISLLSLSLKILLLIIAAGIIGIPTTSFITIIGSCGVAVGLALQGGLSNLAGGVMLLIFKPFKVGDYIESNSKEGTVKSITMFYTTLTTPDNKEIEMPNGTLTNSIITNYSANEERRLDLEFGVSYNSKIDDVKKVLNDIVESTENVLKDKDIIINIIRYDDSAVIYTVRVWVKKENYFNTLFEITEKVKYEFDKNNIEIPFPQLDIHTK